MRTNLTSYSIDQTVDPSLMKFVQVYFVLDNITAKLVGTGDNGEYVNELAESLEFSKDKKEIYVNLREAYFSNGEPITASDVAKSFKRAVLMQSPHTNVESLWLGSEKLKSIDDEIPGIQVLSDSKLKLILTRETKEILFFLTLSDMAVLHSDQYTKQEIKSEDWMRVTSGPYRIDYDKNKRLVLKANPKSLIYDKEMPQQVTFEGYKDRDIVKLLKNGALDFGMIPYGDYLKFFKEFSAVTGYDIVSEKTSGIIYLILNVKSKIFSNSSVRQWIQKKVMRQYEIRPEFKTVSEKAIQFFLPKAKGYVNESELGNLLGNIDSDKVPVEIKNGFTVRTLTGMRYYVPQGLDTDLSRILGTNVDIQATIPTDDYQKVVNIDRDFDATIMGVGMSYKVLGEALNLQYLSKYPFLTDPSGKIRKMLKKYQSLDSIDEESILVSKIIKQMTMDAECIPLFYFSIPHFVNKESVKSTKLNLQESVKFHKFRM